MMAGQHYYCHLLCIIVLGTEPGSTFHSFSQQALAGSFLQRDRASPPIHDFSIASAIHAGFMLLETVSEVKRHFLKGRKVPISFIIDNFTIYLCETLGKKIPVGFYCVCWGSYF